MGRMTQPWWAGGPVDPTAPVPQQGEAAAPWMPPPGVAVQQGGPGRPGAGATQPARWTPAPQGAPPGQPTQQHPTQHFPGQQLTGQQLAGQQAQGQQSAVPPGGPGASGPVVSTVGQAPGGPGSRSEPHLAGLGILVVLLVLAALAYGAFVVPGWVTAWASGLDACADAAATPWDCLVSDTTRTQVLLPVIAIFAAFCLARGAGVERRQGRGVGYLYALLGFAALGASWLVGSGA